MFQMFQTILILGDVDGFIDLSGSINSGNEADVLLHSQDGSPDATERKISQYLTAITHCLCHGVCITKPFECPKSWLNPVFGIPLL